MQACCILRSFSAAAKAENNGQSPMNRVCRGCALPAADRAKVCNGQRSVRRCSAKQKPITYDVCAPFAAIKTKADNGRQKYAPRFLRSVLVRL